VVVDIEVVVDECEVGSPLLTGEPWPGFSFGHHPAVHSRWSPEAAADGPTSCNATIVSTAPATNTPM
jgi:hypothetical protein